MAASDQRVRMGVIEAAKRLWRCDSHTRCTVGSLSHEWFNHPDQACASQVAPAPYPPSPSCQVPASTATAIRRHRSKEMTAIYSIRRHEANRVPAGPRRARAAAALAVGLAGAALLAACGSSSPKLSTTQQPGGIASKAFEFSACMRNHGVTNFPDPQVSGTPNQTVVRLTAPVAKSPQFKAASRACAGILPQPQNPSPEQVAAQQHAREQDLLAFARCLRAHGIPNFPDPTSDGQLTLEMIQAAGVNLHAPVVLPAAKACLGAARGTITATDVERAINGTI